MINNNIVVTFDKKSRRLLMSSPFHLADVMRGFPSRRFDPKSKGWRIPLLRSNVNHFKEIQSRYNFQLHPEALEAIRDYEKLMEAPKKVPFPVHAYDFTKSETGFAPMQHQLSMLDTSWGLKSTAWFAKMGTGKTFATIHLAMARWIAGEIDAVVIICPSTLRTVWKKEFKKYATRPYDFQIHEQKARWYDDYCESHSRDRLQVLAVSVEGLGISEPLYDSVCRFYTGSRRILTVCDESSRIKNPDAKRTKRAINLGAVSEYRLILNGTPIAIGIQDLWSQYEFLDPNIIGTGDYWSFKTRYIVMGGYEQKQIVGFHNVEELMNMVAPYTAVVGKEVLNLPPKVFTERPVQITPEQKRLLRLVVKGADSDPNAPLIKVENTLEKVLRCRQIVGGWLPRARVTTHEVEGVPTEVWETTLEPLSSNPKLDDMLAMIEDNYNGSKFIIWSTFTHEIEAIADFLAKKYGKESVECYYGDTEMSLRSSIEDRYCNDPKLRFFVGNPAAAGLGLTLISGENDVMVYYSGTNAYIDRAQSEDRAHRIGQKNSVTIVDMVAEKTVDEIIMASIRSKSDIETYVTAKIREGASVESLLLGGLDDPDAV
jgi:SNF2 family DNA or RNA helicase